MSLSDMAPVLVLIAIVCLIVGAALGLMAGKAANDAFDIDPAEGDHTRPPTE